MALQEPVQSSADQKIVNSLLSRSLISKYEKQLADTSKDKLGDYGLDQPEIQLTINDQSLSLGHASPVGYSRYGLSANSTGVLVVGGHQYVSLTKRSMSFGIKPLVYQVKINWLP